MDVDAAFLDLAVPYTADVELLAYRFGSRGHDIDRIGQAAQLLFERQPESLPALCTHLDRRFRDGTEQAGDGVAFVAHRRIGKGEPRRLVVTEPVQRQGQAVAIDGFAAQRALGERSDFIPDLGPDVLEPRAERRRVLVAENLHIGVVIEQAEIRPPGHEHGKFRRQHEADDRPQRLGPGVEVAERRSRPVGAADQFTRAAAAAQERSGAFARLRDDIGSQTSLLRPDAVARRLT